MTDKGTLLSAMKATTIPEGSAGLWRVQKGEVVKPLESYWHAKPVTVPPGIYTHLFCLTESSVYNEPAGEVVMEDTYLELASHLGFVMRAQGRVLVTGLGLGCVTRGLLANPSVEHVTVIERSKAVLKLVAPYMPAERLTIVQADALEWTRKNKQPFDCAWHDLWTNRDRGEPHLDKWHVRLLLQCRERIKAQGAWSLDRLIRRKLIQQGFAWIE